MLEVFSDKRQGRIQPLLLLEISFVLGGDWWKKKLGLRSY
jgi:hypothetical protein